MSIGFLLLIVLPFILNFALLTWWRYSTEWDDDDIKFPTRGHYVLLVILAMVPIISWIEIIILGVQYGMHRNDGDIVLKKNNFNKFWFDIDE